MEWTRDNVAEQKAPEVRQKLDLDILGQFLDKFMFFHALSLVDLEPMLIMLCFSELEATHLCTPLVYMRQPSKHL